MTGKNDELKELMDLIDKIDRIDRIKLSCNLLKNWHELNIILSNIKEELANKIIVYYNENLNYEKIVKKGSQEDKKKAVNNKISKLKNKVK